MVYIQIIIAIAKGGIVVGPQFHETIMGQRYYNQQLPKLIKVLERIADNQEKTVIEPVNEFDKSGIRTKEFEEHQEAISELSIVNIMKAVDYINELSMYILKGNDVLNYLNDVVEPLCKVIDKCRTDEVCPKCGCTLFKSDLPQYEYVCGECDENF